MHFLRVSHVDGETSFRGVLHFLSFFHVEGEISFEKRELEMKIELSGE